MIQTRDAYGPWALITGASSGIGAGFARHLAREGLDIVLASRSAERLTALGAELTAAHGTAHRVVPVDLSAADAVQALADATADLDVGLVVSNAGAPHLGPFLDRDAADLHADVALNATAHLDIAHHFGRRLRERGRGGLVLVSALGALHGLPLMANDSAAKAYVANLGEALHHELRPAGVDVTVLLPGNVDTPIINAIGLDRTAMPMRTLPVDVAVAEAMDALARGRARHIPGRLPRTAARVVPRSLSIAVNAKMMAGALDRRPTG